MFIVAPFLLAAIGGSMGFIAFRAYLRWISQGKALLLFFLIMLALAASVIPNVGQQLYDVGLSLNAIDALEYAAYFILAFAIAGAWLILISSNKRWYLLVPIAIAFFQPALWMFALIIWSVKGFAP